MTEIRSSIQGVDVVLGPSGLSAGGVTVYLTSQETRVLRSLIINQVTGCKVEDIVRSLGYEATIKSRHIAQAHISNIRKKLIHLINNSSTVIYDEITQKYVLL